MQYLKATYYLDFKDPAIQELIAPFKNSPISDAEKVIRLYTLVRDQWRYDPYNISFSKESFKASNISKNPSGNCIEKSILLISLLRGLGFPARIQLAKVKNHIAAEKLIEKFGTSELTPHGMVNVYLNDKWLKMSPAFNKTLCEKYNVDPLDFDGENDSFLQQFNKEGTLFMEYLEDYGFFDDVPLDFMKANFLEHYPHIFNDSGLKSGFGTEELDD